MFSSMYQMTLLKIVLFLMVMLINIGCSVKNQSTVKELVKERESLLLFHQKLYYPTKFTKTYLKLYPSKYLQGEMGKSWKNISVNIRTIEPETFYFKKTRSRRFSTPYYEVKLVSPQIIKEIVIYHNEQAYNDKKERIWIDPALYKVKTKEYTKNVSLFTKFQKDRVTEYRDIEADILVDTIHFRSNKPVKRVFIAFDDLQDLAPTKYITILKYPTIKIIGYTKKEVVFYNLQKRKNKVKNETLVSEVAQEDKKLFAEIQKNAKKFILPSDSLAFFPKDIDVEYALKNKVKILKTERYLNIRGNYKHLHKSDFFDENYDYKSQHKVKVAGKKVTIKKGASSLDMKNDFIDFSQGL